MEEQQNNNNAQGLTRLRLFGLIAGVLVVAALGWLLLSGVGGKTKISHIILISIDTCRADYLSCYGYPQKTTPNIDAIAQEGILFENVLTPVPLTLPAHTSMLTGMIPPKHGVHLNFDNQLAPSAQTLAEILKGKGLATAAVISAFSLDTQFGLNQGFDIYMGRFDPIPGVEEREERTGDEANRYAIGWLNEVYKQQRPSFLFLHYYDPHDPYVPPEPFASRFPDSPYAGEIAFTDYCIGQVIGKLKETNVYDSSLIIITGDHGEMLGEHGEPDHGYYLYESAVKVPLIIKLPGKHKPRRIQELVSLVDIVPTICGLLSIPCEADVWGINLANCLLNEVNLPPARALYCESVTPTIYNAGSLLGVVTDRWKYIQTTRPELYDLTQDPDEASNLASAEVELAADMQTRLAEILESQVRQNTDSQLELDERARQRLESLGYVGGGNTEGAFEFDTSKEDPKDLIAFHASTQKLIIFTGKKQYDQAVPLCKQLIQQRPSFEKAHRLLGTMLVEQGDYEGAIAPLERAQELVPDSWTIHHNLSIALRSLGRFDEAIKHSRKALELNTQNEMIYNNLGLSLWSQGKLDEAIKQFRQALTIQPYSPITLGHIGNALLQQGKAKEAVAYYQRALQLKPDFTKIRYMLGVALNALGKTDEAIQCYTEVLRVKSDDARAHSSLGIALISKGRIQEAIKHLQRAIEIDPDLAESYNYLAKVMAVTSRPAEAAAAFREVVRLQPDNPIPMNDLAWILATSLEEAVRDADEAVKLAERACELTQRKEAGFLDTLAAAYAEAEQFDQAVVTIQEAIALAKESQATELIETFDQRLTLYQQGKAYREASLTDKEE